MLNRSVGCAFIIRGAGCVRADGVRWWRDAVSGVADGTVAGTQRASRAGGARAASTLTEPLLVGWRRQPAAAAASQSQQRHVSTTSNICSKW